MNNKTHCAECGAEFVASGITTGYGTDENGVRHCFECCGKRDRADMIATGRATLYLVRSPDGHTVTNWPGTLKFKALGLRTSRHNIARRRYDFWFPFDGNLWHGVQYGDNTQIAHCRRTKDRA